jgi:ABC-type lipoprotein release transport system permease subunit
MLSLYEVFVVAVVIVVSSLACLLPAWKMQSQTLKDGLAPRL